MNFLSRGASLMAIVLFNVENGKQKAKYESLGCLIGMKCFTKTFGLMNLTPFHLKENLSLGLLE